MPSTHTYLSQGEGRGGGWRGERRDQGDTRMSARARKNIRAHMPCMHLRRAQKIMDETLHASKRQRKSQSEIDRKIPPNARVFPRLPSSIVCVCGCWSPCQCGACVHASPVHVCRARQKHADRAALANVPRAQPRGESRGLEVDTRIGPANGLGRADHGRVLVRAGGCERV